MKTAPQSSRSTTCSGLTAVLCLLAWSAFVTTAAAQSEPEATNPVAIEELAFNYFIGTGRARDHEAAFELFEEAAAAGLPNSQLMLGRRYFDGDGVPRDERRAFQLLQSAANQGLAQAQTTLGWMYLAGAAVPRDAAQALRWLSAAAQQGNARALGYLGEMYGRGFGVERDEELSRRLMKRAAELGDTPAAKWIGTYLLFGPADQRNGTLGKHYLEKAAAAKDTSAAYMLGQAFLIGQSVNRDFSQAARWFSRAADGQHYLATLWLSEIYAKGLGVTADPQKGKQLLELGLANASAYDKNEFAWPLAVIDDDVLRNGRLAVRIMESVLVGADALNPAYLDTAAAAHAAAGDFNAAVVAQQAALKQLAGKEAESRMRERFQQRLNAYRAKQDYREPRP